MLGQRQRFEEGGSDHEERDAGDLGGWERQEIKLPLELPQGIVALGTHIGLLGSEP